MNGLLDANRRAIVKLNQVCPDNKKSILDAEYEKALMLEVAVAKKADLLRNAGYNFLIEYEPKRKLFNIYSDHPADTNTLVSKVYDPFDQYTTLEHIVTEVVTESYALVFNKIKEDPIRIGVRIKQARERKGLSIKQLAALMKVTPETAKSWEDKSSCPSGWCNVLKLLDILDIDIYYLVTGKK
jgi:DNA-binding transcriptional regulator YiaG